MGAADRVPPGTQVTGDGVERPAPRSGGDRRDPAVARQPAAAPMRPRGGRGAVAAVVLAGAAVLVAVVVAVSGGDGGGTPDGEEREERAVDEAAGAPSTTSPAPPTSVTVAPPGGGFRIEIPGSWVVGYPNAQGAALADQMVPDRPDQATHIAFVEAALVAPDTRMVALDPAGLGDLERLPDLLVVDAVAGPELTAASTDELVELAAPVDAGAVGARGAMQGAHGEVGWVEIDLAAFDVHGVRYVVTGTDTVWVLTFWSHHLDRQRGMADEMVAGFDPD